MEKNKLLLVIALLFVSHFSNACCKGVMPKKHLLIFVSSSMPLVSLRKYAAEAEKYSGQLIIKGLVESSFIKTKNFIQSISSTVELQINDGEFERFGVTSVPTIVLVKDQEDLMQNSLIFDKIVGNISLQAALELFKKQGEVLNAAFY